MGLIIPQVVTEDKAGGAQVIDGGLRFDTSKDQYLIRTPSSTGNRKTFTFSAWFKRGTQPSEARVFNAASATDGGGSNPRTEIGFGSGDLRFHLNSSGSSWSNFDTSSLFRDSSAWYHIVWVLDTTQSTGTDQRKIYVNGVLQTALDNSGSVTQNQDTPYNTANYPHILGGYGNVPTENNYDGLMSQVYLIDGQALDPSYFGYTDPLTNTWRPRKLKTTGPNNGKTWSSSTTGTFVSSPARGADKAFDGNVNGTIYAQAATGTTASITNLGITDITKIRLNIAKNSTGDLWGTVSLDSTNITSWLQSNYGSQGNTAVWIDVTSQFNSSTLNSISITTQSNDTDDVRLAGVEINGIILVDGSTTNATFGTNGFYLPFDGNSPIGQDQSGNGNNWTPVNFGGSNTIEKATGALPILNTDGGGKVARVGVRTDSNASSLVLALPLVGIKSDFSNAINSGTSNKAITANGNAAASSAQSNFYGGSFVFDGTSDYIDIAASSDFAFGTGDFTVECWIYTTNTTSDSFYRRIYLTDGPTGNAGGNFQIALEPSTGKVNLWDSVLNLLGTSNVCNGAWHHIAGCRSGTTLRLFVDGVLESSTTYSTSVSPNSGSPRPRIGSYDGTTGDFDGYIQDLRVYKGLAKYTQNFIPASTDPDILPDTPSGVAYSSNVALVPSTDGAVVFDGSGDSLTFTDNGDMNPGSGDFTLECFLNTTNLTGERHYPIIQKGNTASNNLYDWRLYFNDYGGSGFAGLWFDAACSGTSVGMQGVQNLRTNQWYHVAITRSSGTFRLFLNGIVEDTDSTTSNAIDNDYTGINIGYNDLGGAGPTYLEGFISNLHFVKGTALYTSNFTPPTAPITTVANTKLLCCKSNSSATASDVTPGSITANGNAVATNFNPFTVNINAVRGQESGYATFNPLDANSSGTLSNGNLQWASAANAHYSVRSSFSMKTGKWYAEGTVLVNTNSVGSAFGIALRTASLSSYTGDTGSWSYHSNGNKYLNGGSGSSFGIAYGATVGNVVGLAFDADNGNLDAYCNGVYQGRVVSGLSSDDYFWMVNAYNWTWGINFGQKPFKFPPPAGFQPLALANTPRPTIVRPDQYINSVIYTGNGGTQTVSGLNFYPDIVWIMGRSASRVPRFTNSVSGASRQFYTDSTYGTNAEEGGSISSYNSNGFVVTDIDTNENTKTFVGWCWKAGGQIGIGRSVMINDTGYATASTAGLNTGTITPTAASVNTKSGLSIIHYTGTGSAGNISHGLGREPKLAFIKRRDSTGAWTVYYNMAATVGAGVRYMVLNTTVDGQYDTSVWNSTPATSSLFHIGSSTLVNTLNATYLACIWAEVPGFSKFGFYDGNGNADGVYIHCGFKPAWVMTKVYSGSIVQGWNIHDNARGTYNPNSFASFAGNQGNESTSSIYYMDFLSNGFKARGTDGAINASGHSYIYAAFAETPSFNLYGGQANAR